jgi:hypothetical protein
MTQIELKIKAKEILIEHPDMLSSLDAEFGYLLNNEPGFNYTEDEFLYWVVDFYIETENGQDNFHMN